MGLISGSFHRLDQNCIIYASTGQHLCRLNDAPAVIILSALLIYHVALKLPHDIRCLWGRRSSATLLSVINWLSITCTIITGMPLPDSTTQVCIVYSLQCCSCIDGMNARGLFSHIRLLSSLFMQYFMHKMCVFRICQL